MSEDIKKTGENEENTVSAENEENTVPETDDEALDKELDELADTFQKTLDEVTADAGSDNGAPVIQELDEIMPEADGEDEENKDEIYPALKESKKKKKSAGKKVAIVLGVIAALMIVFLISVIVIFVKNPNMMTYLNAITAAEASADFDEKISGYESAAACCEDEGAFQLSMKNAAIEKAIDLTYAEKGFASAYSYVKQTLTEEEIAASKIKTVKKIAEVTANVSKLADDMTALVFGENGTESDLEALIGADIPDEIADAAKEAAANMKQGLEASEKASALGDYSVAGNYFDDAYNTFVSFGADKQALGEKIVTGIYNKGWIYEALYLSGNLLDSSAEDVSEEYAAMQTDIESLSGISKSLFELAEKAVADGAYKTEDCKKLAKSELKLDGAKCDFAAQLIESCAQAVVAFGENNLSKASSDATNALGAENAAGIEDIGLAFFYVKANYRLNVSNAYSAAESLLTEENAEKLSAEQKAEYENMKLAFTALEKTGDIFATYYQSYYQSGTPVDFDAAAKELDAYLTASSNKYDRGFVAYCKYFAKACSDTPDGAIDYLLTAYDTMPDMLGLFAYNLAEYYISENENGKAVEIAREMLEINTADDYALSLIAFESRTEGDIDEAYKLALEGMTYSADSLYCLKEVAIDCLLKKDYENAYGYITRLYNGTANSYSSTYNDIVSATSLVYILNKVYEDADEATAKDLAALKDEVDQLYSYYQLEKLDEVSGIEDGSITVEDIFLKDNFGFDFSTGESD